MDFISLLRNRWFIIVNVFAILAAIFNFTFQLGILEEHPEAYVTIAGLLNMVASFFGLAPIPAPSLLSNESLSRGVSIGSLSLLDGVRRYWFLVINIFFVGFTVMDTLLGLGFIQEYPAWYLTILGAVNTVAGIFGLPPIDKE